MKKLAGVFVALNFFFLTACTETIYETLPPQEGIDHEIIELDEGATENKEITVYQIDPLIKPYKEPLNVEYNNDTLPYAKGETATIQLLVVAKKNLYQTEAEIIEIENENGYKLTNFREGWVRYVLSTFNGKLSNDALNPRSQLFPDPIIDDETETILSGNHAPLWLTIPIPQNAQPGIYTGKVRIKATFDGNETTLVHPFSFQVYDIDAGSTPKLFISNWTFPERMDIMNNGQAIEDDSPLYWECYRKLGELCKSIGQNTYRFNMVRKSSGLDNEGWNIYDFSLMEKEIQSMIDHGGLIRIEGEHVLTKSNGYGFYVNWGNYYDENGKSISPTPWGITDAEYEHQARTFFRHYFRALKKMLDKHGWTDIYIQHLGDEPGYYPEEHYPDGNYIAWANHAKWIKEETADFWPNLTTVDAMGVSPEGPVAEYADIMCPCLDIVIQYPEGYEKRAKEKETWMYTAMGPQGSFANRFVALQSLKHRYLHWLHYKGGYTGWLHWGLMWWHRGLEQNIYQDCGTPQSLFPGGDPYLIYPGYHKVYSSIRAEVQRDGAYDYNLLKLIEAKDPSKAQEFLNRLIYNYDDYNIHIPTFRQTRKEMLEFLAN